MTPDERAGWILPESSEIDLADTPRTLLYSRIWRHREPFLDQITPIAAKVGWHTMTTTVPEDRRLQRLGYGTPPLLDFTEPHSPTAAAYTAIAREVLHLVSRPRPPQARAGAGAGGVSGRAAVAEQDTARRRQVNLDL